MTSHLIGIVATVLLFVVHPMIPVLALAWLVNLIVLAVVITDEARWRRRPLPGAHRAEKRFA